MAGLAILSLANVIVSNPIALPRRYGSKLKHTQNQEEIHYQAMIGAQIDRLIHLVAGQTTSISSVRALIQPNTHMLSTPPTSLKLEIIHLISLGLLSMHRVH